MIRARALPSILALAVGLGALGPGCAPVAGPVDVEAVKAGPEGEYGLATVTLDAVEDLFGGRHERFDIRGGLVLSLEIVLLGLDDPDLTFSEMVESVRTDPGVEPSPALAYNPLAGRYEAEDFDSLYYLTLLEAFEETFRYYDEVIGDDSGATDDRGLVGFYGNFVIAQAVPFPLAPDADNAAYVTLGDAWLTLRVHDQDGVPFAMNGGVIAHEFQHRVWFQNVVRGPAFDHWRSSITGAAEGEGAIGDSIILMRGVDEGLCDIFAIGFTQDPEFINPSFRDAPFGLPKFGAERAYRDLEGEFADRVTYDNLFNGESGLTAADRDHCRSDESGAGAETPVGELDFNPYCLGTVIARTLWETAERDPATLREVVLPAVNDALPRVGEQIAAASEVNGGFTFTVPMVLQEIALSLDAGGRQGAFCAEAELRFRSLVEGGRVPACP